MEAGQHMDINLATVGAAARPMGAYFHQGHSKNPPLW
ncbi:MAG: hypothetical protein JWR17_2162 [Pseudomonas sp.]|nr:hypothetical protein [Pseudomonas sp.]